MSGPHTRLIRASSDLLTMFGTRTDEGHCLTAEWGEPIGHCPDSDEDIYEPTFTVTDDGWLEGIVADVGAGAVTAYLASPEAAEGLARALLRIAYPWHDLAVDDPPVMEVGDLSNSGTEMAHGLATAILAAWQQERS